MAPWPLEGWSRQRSSSYQRGLENYMVAANWRHAHQIIFHWYAIHFVLIFNHYVKLIIIMHFILF
jgi:hypothetical protein